MKYKQLLFTLFLFLGACGQAQDSTGMFTVKAPANIWEFLFTALDKSEAPAKDVNAVKEFLFKQIQAQIKKPVADSLPKKPAVKKEAKKD